MSDLIRPLTIAIVTNNYKPYNAGVVSSIISLADGLKNQGHKVYIITLEFQDGHLEDEENIIRLKCPLKFYYHGNPMAVPWRPYHNLQQLFQTIKPDIVHSQHPFYLGDCALKAARSCDIPIAFTYHTQYEKYAHYLPVPEVIGSTLAKKLALNYCEQVNAIIVPSKSIAEQLNTKNLENKIHVIPSAINPIFFEERNTETPNKQKFNLITVSRFVKEKNIPFLLRIFSKLDQSKFSLTLVGYGAEQDALMALATKLGIIESVNFIISPPKATIAKLCQQSDLFIFASQTETQGLVLAEALACGTPVVALEAPGSIDIIQNGINGYLVKTEEEMANIINMLATNSKKLKELKQGALKLSSEYTQEIFIKKITDLYFTLNLKT